MASKELNCIDLGFSEKQISWRLTNRFFPSKIGGKVAWLELENIPETKDLSCDYCNEPCTFLCQIYAAGHGKLDHAFHRTIFVFICRNGKCCNINQSGNIKVLRSQLPLKNQFYPDTPADESIEIDEIESFCNTCNVCGCKAPMVCGKCKKIYYCGKDHQKIDWKSHRIICGQDSVLSKTSQCESYHFPEFEIVIEREDEESDVKIKQESDKEAEIRRLREYEDLLRQGKIVHNSDITEDDLKEFDDLKEDKAFGRFKKAIEKYPTQVIRYNRHALEPLWISSKGILNKSNIPNCLNCNSKRSFEFQIMPQMLNDLKDYDLDWGIIAIYTCENDCYSRKYIHEFCYKQDVTRADTDSFNIDVKNKLKISENECQLSSKDDIHSKKFKASKNNENVKTKENSKKSFTESNNWE
ncbi:programmed cell death protein 2 [Chironomus tepperi]|uniref:programmed cell death protein 2 n=1 Tax=Chironomus tepperi TaxID=113505 RepID=UPI00391F125E